MKLPDAEIYPNFAKLVAEMLSLWPDHAGYLEKSVSPRDADFMLHTEKLSEMIVRLAPTIDGGLTTLACDYRFLCEEIVLPEELHFRRNGGYRLNNFEDALRLVYSDFRFHGSLYERASPV